ncbi:MAG TPA: hypothetical protein VGQ83_39160 [Polyangia bacterium]
MQSHTLLGLAALLALTAGCYGNATSPFPPGLAPAGDNVAAYPAAEGDEAYPEKFTLVTGSNDSYSWANLKGYIHAPIADVWAALQDPDVVVDRRNVDAWTAQRDVEPDYDVSFMVSETVYDLITIEFQVTWREGTVARSAAAPSTVIAVYQKTWGSTVIDAMTGSVLLKRIDGGTTAVETIEHLSAVMSADDSVASYQPDLFNSLKARVHGAPLPTY